MPDIEIFDSIGNLTTENIDPAEVEKLPPEKRERLFNLITAARATEAAEDRLKAAEKLVALKMTELAQATEADRLVHPPTTFLQELRKVQNRPRE